MVFLRALPSGDLFIRPEASELGAALCLRHGFELPSLELPPLSIQRKTYFIDRCDYREGTASVKSFERGNIEERRDVCEYLSALAG